MDTKRPAKQGSPTAIALAISRHRRFLNKDALAITTDVNIDLFKMSVDEIKGEMRGT